MPSIYPNLKASGRKYIRTQKALIRRQFLDVAKQEEMISELYKRMLPSDKVKPEVKKETSATNPVEEVKKTVAKKPAKVKKTAVK